MHETCYRYGKNALRAVPIADLNVMGTVGGQNVYYERNFKDATDFPDQPDSAFFSTASNTAKNGGSSELDEFVQSENKDQLLRFNVPPLTYFKTAMDFVLEVANNEAEGPDSFQFNSAFAAEADNYIKAYIAGPPVLAQYPYYHEQWPIWLANELKKVKEDLDTEKQNQTPNQNTIKDLEAREKVLTRELDAYSDDIVETFTVFKENGGFAPMESAVAEKDQADEKAALTFINRVHNAEVTKTGYGLGPFGTGLYGTGIYKGHRGGEFGWADGAVSVAGLLLAIPFLQYLVLLVGGKELFDRVTGGTPTPTAADRYFAQAGIKSPFASLGDRFFDSTKWWDSFATPNDSLPYRGFAYLVMGLIAWPLELVFVKIPQSIPDLVKLASWIWANLAEVLVKMPMGLFKFLIQHHKWSDEGVIGTLKRSIDGFETFLVNVFSFPAILANHTLAALEDVWDQLTAPVDEDSVIELYDRFRRRGGKDSPYTQDEKTGKWKLNGKEINWENHPGTVTAIIATKILRGVFDTIPTVLSRAVTNTLRSIVKPLGLAEGPIADQVWEGFRVTLYALTVLFIAVITGWAAIGAAVGAGVPLLGAWLGTMFTGMGTGIATAAAGVGTAVAATWGFLVSAWTAGITLIAVSAAAKTALIVTSIVGGVGAVVGLIAKKLLANQDETSDQKLKFTNEASGDLKAIEPVKDKVTNRTAAVVANQKNPKDLLKAYQAEVASKASKVSSSSSSAASDSSDDNSSNKFS